MAPKKANRAKAKDVVISVSDFPPLGQPKGQIGRKKINGVTGEGASNSGDGRKVVLSTVDQVVEVTEQVTPTPLVVVEGVGEGSKIGKDADGVNPVADVVEGDSPPYDNTSTIGPSLKAPQPVDGPNPKSSAPIPRVYASLFHGTRLPSSGTKLGYIQPAEDGEIELSLEDRAPVEELWGFCLVGCFTGRFPGVQAVDHIRKSWGVSCKMAPCGRGWTVFRFSTAADRDKVCQGGPYMVYGKTLMLKVVQDDTVLDDELFLDVPLWVKFYGLPPGYWTETGISKVASKLGKPLFTDSFTHNRSRVAYARALVEVDIRGAPISDYRVRLPGGRSYIQHVEYEQFPEYCYHCKSFNHCYDKCKDLQKKEGVDQNMAPVKGDEKVNLEVQHDLVGVTNSETVVDSEKLVDGTNADPGVQGEPSADNEGVQGEGKDKGVEVVKKVTEPGGNTTSGTSGSNQSVTLGSQDSSTQDDKAGEGDSVSSTRGELLVSETWKDAKGHKKGRNKAPKDHARGGGTNPSSLSK